MLFHYFSVIINPLQEKNDFNTFVVTETKDNYDLTGWKLFRIPLNRFGEVGDPEWNDVRSFRLRVESAGVNNPQILKIAKIELVQNDWQELGVGHINDLENPNPEYDFFSVEVINTDESYEYKETLDCTDCGWAQPNIVREYDEYNEIVLEAKA